MATGCHGGNDGESGIWGGSPGERWCGDQEQKTMGVGKCRQSALARFETFFRGDLRKGPAAAFSFFSIVLESFQDKIAEIRNSGVRIAATYPKKVQGSLATHMMKVLSMPSQVLGSVFNGLIGSCFTSGTSALGVGTGGGGGVAAAGGGWPSDI